jgi:hypothetical protein
MAPLGQYDWSWLSLINHGTVTFSKFSLWFKVLYNEIENFICKFKNESGVI